MIGFYFFSSHGFLGGKLQSFGAIFPQGESSGRTVRWRVSAGRSVSCRTMKCQGPLLAASGGDAAPHVPVEAAVLQCPHSIAPGDVTVSAPIPSKVCTSKKASTSHLPHAPVQPPMAQSIPPSTPTAAEDGAMNDAQQVFEESPTRLCSSLFQI
jgi:hypothetical protein